MIYILWLVGTQQGYCLPCRSHILMLAVIEQGLIFYLWSEVLPTKLRLVIDMLVLTNIYADRE